MNNKQFATALKKEFFKRLEERNSWGKEQCKVLYNEVVVDVVLGECSNDEQYDSDIPPVKIEPIKTYGISKY